jgi:hypothetical protein
MIMSFSFFTQHFKKNPEIQRTFVHELTGSRLLVMPLLVGIICFLLYEKNMPRTGSIAHYVYNILIFIIGVVSCTSLVKKIDDDYHHQTIDWLKMSSIDACSFAIGRWFLATSYYWYAFILFIPFLAWLQLTEKNNNLLPFMDETQSIKLFAIQPLSAILILFFGGLTLQFIAGSIGLFINRHRYYLSDKQQSGAFLYVLILGFGSFFLYPLISEVPDRLIRNNNFYIYFFGAQLDYFKLTFSLVFLASIHAFILYVLSYSHTLMGKQKPLFFISSLLLWIMIFAGLLQPNSDSSISLINIIGNFLLIITITFPILAFCKMSFEGNLYDRLINSTRFYRQKKISEFFYEIPMSLLLIVITVIANGLLMSYSIIDKGITKIISNEFSPFDGMVIMLCYYFLFISLQQNTKKPSLNLVIISIFGGLIAAVFQFPIPLFSVIYTLIVYGMIKVLSQKKD